MELSLNKTRCASGSKWKMKERQREKSESERHERQRKMPINFYCCVMKVWWMQEEGTREGAVILLSLGGYETPSCCCQLLKICNLKINTNGAASLMTEREYTCM